MVEAAHYVIGVGLHGAYLAVQNVGGRARFARVAEKQRVFEFVERLRRNPERIDDNSARRELDEVEPAERGGVLVLHAALHPDVLPLDFVCKLSDLVGREGLTVQGRQSGEQRNDHGGRRAEARARRGVGMQEQIHPLAVSEVRDGALHDVQFPVIDELAVGVVPGDHVVVEAGYRYLASFRASDGGVGELVNGGGKHHPTPLLEIRGDVRPSSSETDAQRRFTSNHHVSPAQARHIRTGRAFLKHPPWCYATPGGNTARGQPNALYARRLPFFLQAANSTIRRADSRSGLRDSG